MAECPHCEYNKKRAHNWRTEAYRLAGHPLPEREWVGLTDEERKTICEANNVYHDGLIEDIEAKLKEKNNDVF